MNNFVEQMHKLANQVILKAYAPYSKFFVAAVILTPTGNLYAGCNIENASYPCGSCAENSAIANMILAGEREIKEILVMGGMQGHTNNDLITPCGQCRQKINEFASNNCIIHMANSSKILMSVPFATLLPYSFGPNNLL